MALSNNQVKRAGKVARDWWMDPRLTLELTPEEIEAAEAAVNIVIEYRSYFSEPMLKVRMGLTSFVSTCGIEDAKLGQRLKRINRILAKLERFNPKMQLTTMQDIGGVRVVVPSLDALRELERHIRKRWGPGIRELYDYIAEPQDSGYRAVHIVVVRDGYPIEIQLRTERQNTWAQLNEALARQAGAELKWGEGPGEMKAFLEYLGETFAIQDAGGVVDDETRTRLRELAAQVQ
jgi:ppGpp synthetase/RelA/SpoT-type nucleotidyltranferase